MLNLSDVETRLDDINEVLQNLLEGFKDRDKVLVNHTRILVHQTKLLTEIKEILTVEPTEESPLVTVIKQLVRVVDGQTVILHRLEKAVAKLGVK
jgi:hypothetical protein